MRILISTAALPLLLACNAAWAGTPGLIQVSTRGLREVNVSAQDGPIRVQAVTHGQAFIRLSQDATSSCHLDVQRRRGVLWVKVQPVSAAPCVANLDLAVPRNVRLVRIANGTGNVFVTGAAQYVSILSTNATVNADGDFVGLSTRVENGSVHTRGTLRDIDVESGAGSVDLVYTQAPRRGNVAVALACGDLLVTMPGKHVAVEVEQANGWLQQPEALRASGSGKLKLTGTIDQGSVFLYSPK